jgi:hypothetical protein
MSAMSAMGSMVPISGLAWIIETKIVSFIMAFSTTEGSIRPCLSTGR